MLNVRYSRAKCRKGATEHAYAVRTACNLSEVPGREVDMNVLPIKRITQFEPLSSTAEREGNVKMKVVKNTSLIELLEEIVNMSRALYRKLPIEVKVSRIELSNLFVRRCCLRLTSRLRL